MSRRERHQTLTFNVVSLFTKIPVADTIQTCVDTLHRDENLVPPDIPEPLFRKLLVKATTYSTVQL